MWMFKGLMLLFVRPRAPLVSRVVTSRMVMMFLTRSVSRDTAWPVSGCSETRAGITSWTSSVFLTDVIVSRWPDHQWSSWIIIRYMKLFCDNLRVNWMRITKIYWRSCQICVCVKVGYLFCVIDRNVHYHLITGRCISLLSPARGMQLPSESRQSLMSPPTLWCLTSPPPPLQTHVSCLSGQLVMHFWMRLLKGTMWYAIYSVFHDNGHQEKAYYKLILGVLRSPKVSLAPQGWAQITFR